MSGCEAVLPVPGGSGLGLGLGRECGAPAVSIHAYACVHEHIRIKASCAEHQPEPGAVGCRSCFEAGHECEMTAGPSLPFVPVG